MDMKQFEKRPGIYEIQNTKNNKRYIGQSTNIRQRIKAHIQALNNNTHRNQHLQNSWNKDKKHFKITILTYCEEKELDTLEQHYIKKYKTNKAQHGYNKDTGGNKNKTLSKETKQYISEEIKKAWKNPESKLNSEARNQKISNKMSGEKHYFYGTKFSKEHKNKIAEGVIQAKNTTGIYRVTISKNPTTKQGFSFQYQYHENNKIHTISSVNLNNLKERVLDNNLPWRIIDENKAKQTYEINKTAISSPSNNSGLYHVSICRNKGYKQGFVFQYHYTINNEKKSLSSNDLNKLRQRVIKKKLPWKVIDEKKAQETFKLNNKYNRGG